MFPLIYGGIYKTPANHQPPDDTNLASNSEYPNLNSRDYAKRPYNRVLRMHSWDGITLNEENNAIIATNKLSGREWSGSLWGFEDVTGELTAEKCCFKLQCNALISGIKYFAKNMFILALHSGRVQVWSTHSEVRNPTNPYCLFLVGEKCEHMRPVTSMEVVRTNAYNAITGDKDGTLKVWDMGKADLYSIHTFRFAHTDVITGVGSSLNDASIFVTCSSDKSALLWDDRLTRPAIGIYEAHSARFKDIVYANQMDNGNTNTVYVGDEHGCVHNIDVRLPNKFIESHQYFHRPVRKILPNGDRLAVIGDTNVVKISNARDHKIICISCDSENFVRDCAWKSPSQLVTVGFDNKIHIHEFL